MSQRATIGLVLGACLVIALGGYLLVGRMLAGVSGHGNAPGKSFGGRVFGGKSFAGKPIPAGAQATVQKDVALKFAAYYRKNLVEAYRQHGKHSPSWDEDAEKYLDGYALNMANAAGAPEDKQMDKMGEALLAKHCDDPLVLEGIGRREINLGQTTQAAGHVRVALDGIKARGYPAICQAWTYADMAMLAGEVGPTLERADFVWRPLAINAYADATDKANFGSQEQRALWIELQSMMQTSFRRSQAVFVEAIKARPGTDPWLRDMIFGVHTHDYAWARRGGGFMDTVSPSDREAFGKVSAQSAGYFQDAYKLHPEYPESCEFMIDIVNSSGEGEGSVRDWFDGGVAAQLDYMPLYAAVLNALLPRWGGSHEAMLAFGKECLDTGRFDTKVPAVYSDSLVMIEKWDSEDVVSQDPTVWANLKTLYVGLLAAAQKSTPDDVKKVRTAWAVNAWRAGHPDEAREQLGLMNGSVDRDEYEDRWVQRPELFVAQIYAQTGPHKEQVAQAERLYDERQTEKALAAFDALAKGETDEHAKLYLRDRVQTLQWEKQFDANEWVNLQVPPDLAGWDPREGTFRPLDDGSGFVVNPNKEVFELANNMRPGRWFELQCDVEFPKEDVTGIEAGLLVDLPIRLNAYFDTFRVQRKPCTAFCGFGTNSNAEHALAQVPQQTHLRLVQCEDRITFYVNEEAAFQDRKVSTTVNRAEGPHHFGLGGQSWPDPTKPVIYRNIRVHKMGG